MVFKLNISQNGKAWKLELEGEALMGKSVGDKIQGQEINPDLTGYELEITGGTDFAGFPMYQKAEGIGLKRVLFTKGWGMHNSRKGVRLRKTVRGKTISEKVIQINFNVSKIGDKKLEEIFPDQNAVKQSSPEPSTDNAVEGKLKEGVGEESKVEADKKKEIKSEKKNEEIVEEKIEETAEDKVKEEANENKQVKLN